MPTDLKKILRNGGLITLFIFIAFYAFFRSKDLIFGVKIRDVNIIDGAKYTESVQKITGNAKNAIKLTINGREVSIDQSGNWNEDIALLLGYNILEIRAEDKFGHTDIKNYKLIRESQK